MTGKGEDKPGIDFIQHRSFWELAWDGFPCASVFHAVTASLFSFFLFHFVFFGGSYIETRMEKKTVMCSIVELDRLAG